MPLFYLSFIFFFQNQPHFISLFSTQQTTMTISSTNLLILHLVISAFIVSMPASASTGGDEFIWMSKQGGCRGSIAECMGDAAEMEMQSESTRRILATTNYISYGALQGNNVPCSQRGASYYNCQSGGQANPYQRGCSTITRCRR
uniref:rapid alkalinization factor-like n=1 Tax=Erigeron canadensis TaxID=72917 RepID=UPI001CB99047|nr:rapid alkalinization factor-like [Erigeron canadensis]